jgi:hypothetical protein
LNTLRGVITQVNHWDRDISAVQSATTYPAGDVLTRVIYTENHDQVGHPSGQVRLGDDRHRQPRECVRQEASTLAAAIMLTLGFR